MIIVHKFISSDLYSAPCSEEKAVIKLREAMLWLDLWQIITFNLLPRLLTFPYPTISWHLRLDCFPLSFSTLTWVPPCGQWKMSSQNKVLVDILSFVYRWVWGQELSSPTLLYWWFKPSVSLSWLKNCSILDSCFNTVLYLDNSFNLWIPKNIWILSDALNILFKIRKKNHKNMIFFTGIIFKIITSQMLY